MWSNFSKYAYSNLGLSQRVVSVSVSVYLTDMPRCLEHSKFFQYSDDSITFSSL